MKSYTAGRPRVQIDATDPPPVHISPMTSADSEAIVHFADLTRLRRKGDFRTASVLLRRLKTLGWTILPTEPERGREGRR